MGPRRELRLRCPKCHSARGVGNLNLYKNDQVCSIPCSTCKIATSANRWECECGGPWVQCPSCRPLGFQCRSTKRPRSCSGLDSNSRKAQRSDEVKLDPCPDWLSRAALKRLQQPIMAAHKRQKACSTMNSVCSASHGRHVPLPPLVHDTIRTHKRKLSFDLGSKFRAKFPEFAAAQTTAGDSIVG